MLSNPRAYIRIDELVDKHMAEHGVAGAALAVTRNGEVLYTKGYGRADVDKGVDVTLDTPFAIGACTMTYTAWGLLKLQDQGKLSVNLPLRTYMKLEPGTRPHAFGKIPLARFLAMSGGLPDREPLVTPWTEILQSAMAPGPRYIPGSRNLFSHPSYLLLGSLIETITEESWVDWTKREVLGKDGMNLSGTTICTGKKSPKNMAVGYRFLPVSEQWTQAETVSPEASYSSGAIAASITGLAEYMVKLDQQEGISEQSYRSLFKRIPLRSGRPGKWAMGWEVRDPDHVAGRWGVHGDVPGYDSSLLRAPKSGFSIALASNTSDAMMAKLPLKILYILERGG